MKSSSLVFLVSQGERAMCAQIHRFDRCPKMRGDLSPFPSHSGGGLNFLMNVSEFRNSGEGLKFIQLLQRTCLPIYLGCPSNFIIFVPDII